MALGAEFNTTSVFIDFIDYDFFFSAPPTNASLRASCGRVLDPRHSSYRSYDKNFFLSDLLAQEGEGASLRRHRISCPD